MATISLPSDQVQKLAEKALDNLELAYKEQQDRFKNHIKKYESKSFIFKLWFGDPFGHPTIYDTPISFNRRSEYTIFHNLLLISKSGSKEVFLNEEEYKQIFKWQNKLSLKDYWPQI